VVDRYLKLGRRRFLRTKLPPTDLRVPGGQQQNNGPRRLPHRTAIILPVVAQSRAINAGVGRGAKQTRQERSRKGIHLAYEAARRELLRSVVSPAQLQEQLTGSVLNHFSVSNYKATTHGGR